MKSGSVVLSMIASVCVSGAVVWAQENLPERPPMGEFGYVDPVSGLPGGMMGGMGGGMGMAPGMPIGQPAEFPENVAARCLLKISSCPLDPVTMRHLWHSSGILNKAYRDILNDPNFQGGMSGESDIISMGGTPSGVIYSVFILNIGGQERDILDLAIENLKKALNIMGEDERGRFREQTDQAHRRAGELEKQIADMQSEIRAITEQGVTNRDDVQIKIGDLQNALGSHRMRQQYCERQIVDLGKQKEAIQLSMARAVAQDTVAEELKNIIKGAEEAVALADRSFQAGQAPVTGVQEAREKLTRAKIELARRLEEVQNTAGQAQLAAIDGKIAELNSDLSEQTMLQDFKASELKKAQELLAKSDQLELLEMRLDAAKKSYRDTLALLEDLKNRLLMDRPISITVLGME
jgi:hypothetical protein